MGARGPEIESRCWQFCLFSINHCDTQLLALTVVPRSNQPFTFRRTVKLVSAYGCIKVLLALDECLAYNSLSQYQVWQLGLWFGGHKFALSNVHSSDLSELSHLLGHKYGSDIIIISSSVVKMSRDKNTKLKSVVEMAPVLHRQLDLWYGIWIYDSVIIITIIIIIITFITCLWKLPSLLASVK